jgi:predicted ArsR family transcriptional regulator
MKDHGSIRQAETGSLPDRDVTIGASVFAFVRDAGRPVDVATIAEQVGLEPRQAAVQVGALCQSGLVVESEPGKGRSHRGKPRYAAATPAPPSSDPPDVLDPGEPPDPPKTQDAYLGLSELLLGILVGDRDPDDVGRMAGRLIGNAVVSSDSNAPPGAVAQLERFLENRGFRPMQIGSPPDIAFVLQCCPFEKAASINPGLVCGLHRAMAEGMAEALGGAFEVTDLVARNPSTAGCRLELRTTNRLD